MTENDFQRSQEALRNAGYEISAARYDGEIFGSWAIEVTREGLPRQQVVWDGKDGWLIVQAFASSGSWMEKWVGRKESERTVENALARLATPVTREWELAIERERAEYWRKVQFEQALSQADRLWDAGCYVEYVSELSPYRDRLSPAQLKQFQIGQKRADAARQFNRS
jgi:hypothetical protein